MLMTLDLSSIKSVSDFCRRDKRALQDKIEGPILVPFFRYPKEGQDRDCHDRVFETSISEVSETRGIKILWH